MDNGLDYLIPQDTTNVIELSRNKNIRVFPNPFMGQINIINPKREPFNIHDSFGRLVYQSMKSKESDKIDLSGYTHGLYILRTLSGKQLIKILKQ